MATITIDASAEVLSHYQMANLRSLTREVRNLEIFEQSLNTIRYEILEWLPKNPVIQCDRVIFIIKGEEFFQFTFANNYNLSSFGDEPAIITPNIRVWAYNNKCHRYSGPAIFTNQGHGWFIHGKRFYHQDTFKKNTPEEFREDFLAGILTHNFHPIKYTT